MKKTTISILAGLVFSLLLMDQQVGAQEYPDSNYSTVGEDTEVNLNLLWYTINHGDIQWQTSRGNDLWEDVSGQATKNFVFHTDSSAMYRARVVSGTCDPVYSKITSLEVIHLRTVKVDSITENSVVVECKMPADMEITEQGIYYDTKTNPDENSAKIQDTSDESLFSIKISDLVPGTAYYVRAYLRDLEDNIILGNILQFIIPEITTLDRINIFQNAAEVFYTFFSTPDPEEHGVYYGTQPAPDTNSLKVTGSPANGKYLGHITGLEDSTTYYAAPFMKVSGKQFLADPIKFKTFTDYSDSIVDTAAFTISHEIVWDDPSEARKISQDGWYAEYGRVCRLGDSDTIFLVHHGGHYDGAWVSISLRKSFDNGVTWSDQEILMDIRDHGANYWRFCCPEILELDNGWILIAYTANGKPETNANCHVHVLTSKDRGETWEGPQLVNTGRSWEPFMLQLPNGELEMFYSSEARWWPGDNLKQEIHSVRSTNNGQNWSYPEVVAYYPEKRDGMPAAVNLQGNKGIVFSIETVLHWRGPYIIKRELAGDWDLPDPVLDDGDTRWWAPGFRGNFGGGPYLVQLPTGETVLSAHVGRGGDWHQNYMQVMIGDNDARNFQDLTVPWGIPPENEGAILSSFFLKDEQTIVIITSRNTAGGTSSIYWLEGKIEPK